MPQKTYPLTAFKSSLDKRLEGAREALSSALVRLEEAEEGLELRRRLLKDAQASHREHTRKVIHQRFGATFDVGTARQEYLELEALQLQVETRRLNLEAQAETVKVRRQARDEARAQVVEAHKSLEAVEQHHGRWKMARRREADRREELERSETARNLWLRRELGSVGA